ncbi:fimbria/pilus periplasmic chaperone [Synechococcus sp. PCC 6717]|nr:fimbria/pilus periplasmic chaperone [Synechococcus sp. PCC 6717]
MRLRYWVLASLWAVAAIVGMPLRLGAQSTEFYLNAVQVFLSPRQRTVLLTLTNTGETPLNFEISLRKWQQTPDGQDELSEADGGVVAFPLLLSVPPGEQRSLRVGVRQPPLEQENTYRLLVAELPSPNIPNTQGAQLRIIKILSLPVFIEPVTPQRQGEFVNASIQQGRLSVTLRNTGNVHIQTLGIIVRGKSDQGAVIFEQTLDSVYVLANRQRDFRNLLLPQTNCAQVRQVTLQTVATSPTITTTIPTPNGICS